MTERRRAEESGFEAAPEHLMNGGREAIDVLREEFRLDGRLREMCIRAAEDEEFGDVLCVAYLLGTARVYELRAGKKAGCTLEDDMRKAAWNRQMADHIITGGVTPDPRSNRRT